ncbi:putative membrane protein [Halobacteriovorax marinus SJ]|uniref:Membrane protein n=1 Tax=Halobacteriovorax marinus (strain ATCC BAA-682 / DSM 15412 / SJ) TaxID=862908 RepID=E1WXA0_HALMS|nr:DUF2391 family protein [Halobacteriovorax marinus]CBW25801.1 putative membrane protein [Halobacteriovorax marinus SJ]
MTKDRFKSEIKQVGGYLKEVVTFFDSSGKPISHVVNPLMVELRPRDITQIFVGALLVSSPLCFTEEVWVLSMNLRNENVIYLGICSIVVVLLFVYFNFYRDKLRGNVIEFIKRIIAIYAISILSIVLVLFLIDKFPIMTTPYIALKRVIIIGFPSIFGAVITDSLK